MAKQHIWTKNKEHNRTNIYTSMFIVDVDKAYGVWFPRFSAIIVFGRYYIHDNYNIHSAYFCFQIPQKCSASTNNNTKWNLRKSRFHHRRKSSSFLVLCWTSVLYLSLPVPQNAMPVPKVEDHNSFTSAMVSSTYVVTLQK